MEVDMSVERGRDGLRDRPETDVVTDAMLEVALDCLYDLPVIIEGGKGRELRPKSRC